MADEDIRLTQLMLNPQDRPRFTHDQLSAYFDRINLPVQFRQQVLSKDTDGIHPHRSSDSALPLLKSLMQHHICSIPFENLILHYSVNKSVTLDPYALFDKFVTRGASHGRGGRCMENNTFFATVLRSLGFSVRTCAGRVSRNMSPYAQVRADQDQTYDGLNHMVLLVRLNAEWYVVDVGMGAMGPTLPYPLRDGHEQTAVAPRKLRIQRRAIPETTAETSEDASKLWCFDVCRQPGAEWLPTYCFTDLEFLPQDYEVLSWYTSTSPRMFFTKLMMATKLLMDDEGNEIIGDLTLVNDCVRRTIEGNREVIAEFKTEMERIQGLKTIFGVTISDEEAISLEGSLRLA